MSVKNIDYFLYFHLYIFFLIKDLGLFVTINFITEALKKKTYKQLVIRLVNYY